MTPPEQEPLDETPDALTQPTAPESPDQPGRPTPAERAIKGATGIPVVMGDGQTWLLKRCGLAKAIEPIRDEFYASLVTQGAVSTANVFAGAWFALGMNYDLADHELTALLDATDAKTIVADVVEAILPLVRPGIRADFSEWARSALFVNGLNPAGIPEADLPWVLDHLVAAERAVSHEEFTAAGLAAGKRARIMSTAPAVGASLPTE